MPNKQRARLVCITIHATQVQPSSLITYRNKIREFWATVGSRVLERETGGVSSQQMADAARETMKEVMYAKLDAQYEKMQVEREVSILPTRSTRQATSEQLRVVLFCAYWLLRSNHHKLHYRQLFPPAPHRRRWRRRCVGSSTWRRWRGCCRRLPSRNCKRIDLVLYLEASGDLDLEQSAFMRDLEAMVLHPLVSGTAYAMRTRAGSIACANPCWRRRSRCNDKLSSYLSSCLRATSG